MKVLSLVTVAACATSSFGEKSFQQLGKELNTAAGDSGPELLNSFAAYSSPVAKLAGLDASLASQAQINPMEILTILGSLNNAGAGFHAAVDAYPSVDAFKYQANMIIASFTNGFIGHLNADGVVGPKIGNVTIDLENLVNTTTDLLYTDLFQIINNDTIGMIPLLFPVITPLMSVIKDIKNITGEIKEMMQGDSRRLVEQVENVADEMHKFLVEAPGLTGENFLCKLEPLLVKVNNLLVIVADPAITTILNDIVVVLKDLDSKNAIIGILLSVCEFLDGFLVEYGPMIATDVLPILKIAVSYLENICSKSTRRLGGQVALTFNPAEIVAKIFDFIESLLAKLSEFLAKIPQPLTDDMVKLIEDLVAQFLPKYNGHLHNIFESLKDLLTNLPALITGLTPVIPALETLVLDVLVALGHAKTLVQEIIKLVKDIV